MMPPMPLAGVGAFLSAAGGAVTLTHASTNWLGIAAFITAITGLTVAVASFILQYLTWWGKRHPPKRGR